MADDAERQRDDNVRNPAVKAPVKEGLKDSLLRFLIIVRDRKLLQVSGLTVVIDWFGDTVIVESNPDTAGEEHGKPREI